MKILIVLRSHTASFNTIREVRVVNDKFHGADVRTICYGDMAVGWRPDLIFVADEPQTMQDAEWLQYLYQMRRPGCVWVSGGGTP